MHVLLEDPALLDGRLSQWLLTPAAPAALQLVRRDHQWAELDRHTSETSLITCLLAPLVIWEP